jgi:hypothetical protein
MRIAVPFALLAVALSAAALPALAGEASGEFSVTKRSPIRPKYAAAYETRDQRDAHKRAIEVVLSDEPIDVKAAVAELDPHTDVINQKALQDHNYVILWVRPGNDVSMNATYSEKMVQYVDMTPGDGPLPGGLKAEMSTNTADRVVGRLFSPKPVKTMDGETYSVDLKFSTEVTHVPAGTKLPAGGADAGKALQALLAAMKKKDYKAIQAGVTPKRVESFSDVDDAVQTLGMTLPTKTFKITGGELRGADTAILEVESEYFAGQKGLTLVRMVRNDTHWQFDRATRAGMID